MPHAEFEEKEFETSLYGQLQVANDKLWSPVQVLENHVGFDYSAFCLDPFLWSLHGMESPYSGISLNGISHSWPWRRRLPDRQLPNFSLNLFLQAKRPFRRVKLLRALKDQPLTSPFWRFEIEPSQQSVLESLSDVTGGQALVCYAAPAFDRITQLYSHTQARSIVENSTFPEASWLTGHEAWNYDKPGASGVLNPVPEYYRGEYLFRRIELLIGSQQRETSRSLIDNLRLLAKQVMSVVQDSRYESGRLAVFINRTDEIEYFIRSVSPLRYAESIRDFMIVHAFCSTFFLKWYVVQQS